MPTGLNEPGRSGVSPLAKQVTPAIRPSISISISLSVQIDGAAEINRPPLSQANASQPSGSTVAPIAVK